MNESLSWTSPVPSRCQFCHMSIGDSFYDSHLKHGSWAIICHSCFTTHGSGLGVGKGQKYDSKTLIKLAG